jgi:16S rRNA (uracil1498-N3)-methyltransferase
MHRFFAPPAQISSSRITLDPSESHHLLRVLRLGVSARVRVFDGADREYECEVVNAARGAVEVSILEELTTRVESSLRIVLAQALIKSDKFDWIIQKSTELGVARVAPLVTEYSDARRIEGRTGQRVNRWQRISLEALKQCGRRRMVEIGEPINWLDYCAHDDCDLKLFFCESGGIGIDRAGADFSTSIESVSVAIGPEGGWSNQEINFAKERGFLPVHTGPRVLRTETAAVVAVALVQYLFGDLKS